MQLTISGETAGAVDLPSLTVKGLSNRLPVPARGLSFCLGILVHLHPFGTLCFQESHSECLHGSDLDQCSGWGKEMWVWMIQPRVNCPPHPPHPVHQVLHETGQGQVLQSGRFLACQLS